MKSSFVKNVKNIFSKKYGKLVFALSLMAVMAFTLFSYIDLGTSAGVSSYTSYDDLKYELDTTNRTMKITGADNSLLTSIVLPPTYTIGGTEYKVTSVYLTYASTISKVVSLDVSQCYYLSEFVTGKQGQSVNNYFKTVNFGDAGMYTIDSANPLTIGAYSFYNCDSLTNVSGIKYVKEIEEYAFYDCGSLAFTNFDDSYLEEIGAYAFYATPITSFESLNNVHTIGDYAFYNCDSLNSAICMNKLTSIGSYAFSGCAKFKGLYQTDTTFAEPLTIGDYAFSNCGSATLKTQMNGRVIAENRYNLEEIFDLTDGSIMARTTYIGQGAFKGTYFLPKSNDGAIKTINNNYSFFIPETVTYIGEGAFGNIKNTWDEFSEKQEWTAKYTIYFATDFNKSIYIGDNAFCFNTNSDVSGKSEIISFFNADYVNSQGVAVGQNVKSAIENALIPKSSDYSAPDMGKISFINDYDSIRRTLVFDGGDYYFEDTDSKIKELKVYPFAEPFSATLPTPLMDEGVSLIGYFDENGKQLTNGSMLGRYYTSFGDETILYARYSFTRDVSFYANGGSFVVGDGSTSTRLKKTNGSSDLLSSVVPTLEGYDFAGWNTSSDGSGLTISSDTSVADVPQPSLYATWTLKVMSNLTFDTAGGKLASGYTLPEKRLYGETIILPTADEISKDGYIFRGWYDSADANKTFITILDDANNVTDINLVAYWVPENITMNYNLDGGEWVSNAIKTQFATQSYGTEFALPTGDSITKTGHTFGYWYLEGDASKTAVTSVSADNETAKNFVAVWYGDNAISYDLDGGAWVSEDVKTQFATQPYGTEFVLPTGNNITKTGHTFGYWYLEGDASKTPVTSVPADNVIEKSFVAVWEPVVYTVTLNSNGGKYADGIVAPNSYSYGNAVDLPTPSHDDYEEFLGWYDNTSFTGNTIASIPANSTGDVEFYALYRAKQVSDIAFVTSDVKKLYQTDGSETAVDLSGVKATVSYEYVYSNGSSEDISEKEVVTDTSMFKAYPSSLTGFGKTAVTITCQKSASFETTISISHLSDSINYLSIMEGTPYRFDYTGDVIEWVTPANGVYAFELWGAGNNPEARGYTRVYLDLQEGKKLYLYLGGAGYFSDIVVDGETLGFSYNGGSVVTYDGVTYVGGGATDIRTQIADDNNWFLSKHSDWATDASLSSRIAVAGGGFDSINPDTFYNVKYRYDFNSYSSKPFGKYDSYNCFLGMGGGYEGAYTYKSSSDIYGDFIGKNYIATNVSSHEDNFYSIQYSSNNSSIPTNGIENVPYTSVFDEDYKANKALNYDVYYASMVESDEIEHEANGFAYVTLVSRYETFTFDANGGSFADGTSSLSVTEEKMDNTLSVVVSSFEEPTKKGYTFVGWYTETEGGEQINTSQAVDKCSTKTYYARWEKDPFVITYYLNGGRITSSYPTTYFSSTERFSLPTPTKNNWVFAGWTGSNGTVPQTEVWIENGTEGDLTFYANWELDYTDETVLEMVKTTNKPLKFYYTGKVQEYVVPATGIYSLECFGSAGQNNVYAMELTGDSGYKYWGGSYAYTEIELKKGDVLYVYVGGNTPMEDGYSFNGGGKSLTGYDSVGGGATDIRLIKADGAWYDTYHDSFNEDESLLSRVITAGGSGGHNLIEEKYAVSIPLDVVAPVSRGKYPVDGGNNTLGLGSSSASYDNEKISHRTCFSGFYPKSGGMDTLIFYTGGAGGGYFGGNISHAPWYGDGISWNSISYEYSDYISESGTSNITDVTVNNRLFEVDAEKAIIVTPEDAYENNATMPIGSVHTSATTMSTNMDTGSAYVTFLESTGCTVTFEANGGAYADGESSVEYDYRVGDSYGDIESPSLDKYIFEGWFTSAEGGDLVDVTTATVDSTTDFTLYAHWIKIPTITFDANGGIFAEDTTTKESLIPTGDDYGEVETPSYEKHIFDGWYTSAEGGDVVDVTGKVEFTDDVSLYAHWIKIPTITFDANGGTFTEDKTTLESLIPTGDDYGEVETPSYDENIFDGWYTEKDGGEVVDVTGKVEFTDDTILYAHWIMLRTITFDANDGAYEDGNTTKDYQIYEGDSYENIETPSLDKYIFDGWYTAKEGGEKVDVTADTMAFTENTTLYAKWAKDELVVTFEKYNLSVPSEGNNYDSTQLPSVATNDTSAVMTLRATPSYKNGGDISNVKILLYYVTEEGEELLAEGSIGGENAIDVLSVYVEEDDILLSDVSGGDAIEDEKPENKVNVSVISTPTYVEFALTLSGKGNGNYKVVAVDGEDEEEAVAESTISVSCFDTQAPSFSSVDLSDADAVTQSKTITVLATDGQAGANNVSALNSNGAYFVEKANAPRTDFSDVTWKGNATAPYSFTVTENGSYYVYVRDHAGNITSYNGSPIVISNIDTTAPTITFHNVEEYIAQNDDTFVYSGLEIASGDGVNTDLTYYAYDNINKKELSFKVKASDKDAYFTNVALITDAEGNSYANSTLYGNGSVWFAFVVKEHTDITVTVTDEAGNKATCNIAIRYDYSERKVDDMPLIDGNGYVSISQNPSDWTKDNVTLSANMNASSKEGCSFLWTRKTDDEMVQAGTFTGVGEWSTLNTYPVSENGTYYLYVKTADEKILYKSYTVSNIDKEVPVISNIQVSSDGSTVTFTVTDTGSGLMKVSGNGGTQSSIREETALNGTNTKSFSFPISGNCTYSIIAVDMCGNKTEVKRVITINTPSVGDGSTHTVTFLTYTGGIIKAENVKHGEDATPPANLTRDGYLFTGWDKSYVNVTENRQINAVWAEKGSDANKTYYVVSFINWDGGIVKSQTVESGGSATPPTSVKREGYTFVGWDSSYANVTENREINAIWEEGEEEVYYNVTFRNGYGGVVKSETVKSGESATPPSSLTRDGFVFIGWDSSYANVTENRDVNAVWAEKAKDDEKTYFVVTFTNYDDSVIKAQTVEKGGTATPPTISRSGYTFTGWSNSYANVTCDVVTKAQFVQIPVVSSSNNNSGSTAGSVTQKEDTTKKEPVTDTKTEVVEPVVKEEYISLGEFSEEATVLSVSVYDNGNELKADVENSKDAEVITDLFEKENESMENTQDGEYEESGVSARTIISILILVGCAGFGVFYFLNKKYYWVSLPF